MDDILSVFKNRIKGEIHSLDNHDIHNNHLESNDDYYANHLLNEKSNIKKVEIIEELEEQLISKEPNISFIEESLKHLGDGYDFSSYINLLFNEKEIRYYDREGVYYKIPDPTRKNLKKYLFYWILKQRETFQDSLSHDTYYVGDESNQISEVDAGIYVDNLFEEVFIDSINYDYFFTALNYLKDVERIDLYNKIKLFTLLQMEHGIKSVIKVKYGNHSRLKIPFNKTIIKAMSEEELKWSTLLYFATQFYNVIQIQLFDLPQFLNGFKLRKKSKIDDYDFSLDF